METKHIRILDDVLNYLYDNRTCEKGKQITHTIISLTKVFTELDISDIENILQKFCKDGCADRTINPLGEKGLIYYYITFEGRVFKESRGYLGKLEKENEENNRITDVENRQGELDENNVKLLNRMVWLTAFVCVGTLVSAAYYVNELNKQYHWW
jgi:hypothetical protein